MKKPGRKTDSLGVAPRADVLYLGVGDLKAPDELTAEQAQIWVEIAASKPAGWFGKDSAALLVGYCVAVSRRRAIKVMLEKKLEQRRPVLATLNLLLELERRQTQTIAMLSTKMRLSQQARYTPQAAESANKTRPDMAKPWERLDG